jgi:uncharacterized phage protein (TIGR02218 family)
MKTISTDLKTHLESEVTTLATCYKITRQDNTVLGFTNLDTDITYDSVTYNSNNNFDRNNLSLDKSFNNETSKIESILDSNLISENDLLTGKYDNAEVEIFIVNYKDLAMEDMILFSGFFGEVKYIDSKFTVELKSLNTKLDTTIGDYYTPTCRATFCDSKCTLTESTYTFSGTVTTKTSNSEFYCSDTAVKDKTAQYFDYGYLTFTSGNNTGQSMEVKQSNAGTIILNMSMPFSIEVNDAFDIVAGCNKTFTTCKNKFSNAINFRGEPHVPGMDYMLQTK